MYSLDDMKKCWVAAGGDIKEFEAWNSNLNSVDNDDVNEILYEWKQHKHLHQYRKLTDGIKKAIKKVLKEYDVDECIDAIKHYAEIQLSSYFLKYKWDIEKFFKQSNGIKEYMSDGIKWINYKETIDSKPKAYSSLSSVEVGEINKEVHEMVYKYRDKYYPSFTINSMSENAVDREREREIAFSSRINQITPILCAVVCSKRNVYIDSFLLSNSGSFMTKFDKIVYSDGTQKMFMDEFNKLNI